MRIMRIKLYGALLSLIVLLITVVAFYPNETVESKDSLIEKAEQVPIEEIKKQHRDNDEDKQTEVIRTTRRLALKFVQVSVETDSKDAEAYFEEIKPYSDDWFFNQLKMSVVPSDDTRKLLNLKIEPLDDVVPNRKKWQVTAFVEKKNLLGKKTKQQMNFTVAVSLKEGKWKISGIEVH